jgi:hypothetical protein
VLHDLLLQYFAFLTHTVAHHEAIAETVLLRTACLGRFREPLCGRSRYCRDSHPFAANDDIFFAGIALIPFMERACIL